MKLTIGGLIPADCVGREIDLSGHVPYHEKGRQSLSFQVGALCTERLPERVMKLITCCTHVMTGMCMSATCDTLPA